MTTATQTNQIVVVRVSETGCTCAINGANRHITWDELYRAAQQGDKALAEVYSGIQQQARKMVEGNRELPIACSVQQNETNVWWVADFTDVAGQSSWIPRDADEGGTLPQRWIAEQEAKARSARLRRLGYRIV